MNVRKKQTQKKHYIINLLYITHNVPVYENISVHVYHGSKNTSFFIRPFRQNFLLLSTTFYLLPHDGSTKLLEGTKNNNKNRGWGILFRVTMPYVSFVPNWLRNTILKNPKWVKKESRGLQQTNNVAALSDDNKTSMYGDEWGHVSVRAPFVPIIFLV